jgi:hypothetical protein
MRCRRGVGQLPRRRQIDIRLQLVRKHPWRLLIAMLAALPFIALGQTGDRVRVVTVCEVFSNLTGFAGTNLAVVGRMERRVGPIDHYEWLSQDNCKQPLTIEGRVRPNRILIGLFGEAGLPEAPNDRPTLSPGMVASRLLLVRRTTKVGVHKEPRFKRAGSSITFAGHRNVPNSWAVVYGRLVVPQNLGKKDCIDPGCHGFTMHAPLLMMVKPESVHTLTDAGNFVK